MNFIRITVVLCRFAVVSAIFMLLSFAANARDYDVMTELYENTSIENVISIGKSCYVYGSTPDITVTLPSVLELTADLRIDDVKLSGSCTVYANGYNLYIGNNVTSDSRLTVYGGGNNTDVSNTSVELYGGLYKTVYAGGYNGTVTGNTRLIFGGNCNIGDGINDKDTTTMSPCNIYGGGNNGKVLGKTEIHLCDNAVAAYIFGAGMGTNGTCADTNIFIDGGKVMNVYGGSSSTALEGCDTHITMTGGMVESLFGASSQSNLTGNTYITLLGGEVTRRVYTGCYNEWSISWKSSYYVNGTTNLIIGKDMLLNTQNGLATQNRTNTGVFCGSRCGKNGNANEVNTVIFLDGCYDTMSKNFGDKSGMGLFFYSHPHYTASISDGGSVSFGESSGTIICKPVCGKYATLNGTISTDENIPLRSGSVDIIDFRDNFSVNSLEVSENENGTSVINVGITHENVFGVPDPRFFLSLLNSEGHIIKIFLEEIYKDEYTFVTDKQFTSVYIIFIDKNLNPLCKKYTQNLTKD